MRRVSLDFGDTAPGVVRVLLAFVWHPFPCFHETQCSEWGHVRVLLAIVAASYGLPGTCRPESWYKLGTAWASHDKGAPEVSPDVHLGCAHAKPAQS